MRIIGAQQLRVHGVRMAGAQRARRYAQHIALYARVPLIGQIGHLPADEVVVGRLAEVGVRLDDVLEVGVCVGRAQQQEGDVVGDLYITMRMKQVAVYCVYECR